ncbi:hypothetical protein SDC9_72941 [bioreactor metagenome]|uniref:Uncharacterized protein n=1 Tax=bioreactor metagenome TaxID=1076179 RepID=A0A644YDT3_9ZZZZ
MNIIILCHIIGAVFFKVNFLTVFLFKNQFVVIIIHEDEIEIVIPVLAELPDTQGIFGIIDSRDIDLFPEHHEGHIALSQMIITGIDINAIQVIFIKRIQPQEIVAGFGVRDIVE